MKILLTAFEPFNGEKINAALETVNRVCVPDGVTLCTLTVPAVFGLCTDTVIDKIRSFRPDAVIMTGQASGRSAISLERIAVNLRDARIPDNAQNQPVDVPVDPDGPAAYFSTLPVKAMREAILAAGVPCELSCNAGTFVCNDLMYGVLHTLSLAVFPIPAGFIHLPCTPEQAVLYEKKTPSMKTEDAAKGLEAAISSLL